jgi:hypothetical protein
MIPLPLEARAVGIVKPDLPAALRGANRAHARMLERSAEALGAAVSDFVGYRVVVPDPPMGATIHLQWRM